jgi:hypothetical protein
MGIDYTVHVGPYVECQTGTIDVKKNRRSCTNPKCKDHQRENYDLEAKFCAKCSSPIGDVEYSAKGDRIDLWQVIEEIDEALMPPHGSKQWSDDVDLYVPNLGRPNRESRKYRFYPKESGFILYDIDHQLILDEMGEFCVQYREAIETIRKHYGDNNVKIKWGVIHTVS